MLPDYLRGFAYLDRSAEIRFDNFVMMTAWVVVVLFVVYLCRTNGIKHRVLASVAACAVASAISLYAHASISASGVYRSQIEQGHQVVGWEKARMQAPYTTIINFWRPMALVYVGLAFCGLLAILLGMPKVRWLYLLFIPQLIGIAYAVWQVTLWKLENLQ